MPADPLPSYKPDLFVNREDMIALVIQKAIELAGGKSVRNRIDFFRGPQGSGKTWLLRQLAETILPALYGVRPVYINLEVLQAIPPEEALKEIMVEIIQTCFGAESEEMDWLIASAEFLPEAQWKQFLTERLPRKNIILILCLDHVSETATERLQYLEKALLVPFALRSDTYLIMTGRGAYYNWESTEFRLNIDYHDLKPFTLPHTREQLEKVGFDSSLGNAEKILADSTGYPGLNYLLAQSGEPQEIVAQAVENNLSRLSPGNRERLEALSIPRTFTDELLPRLLAVYYTDPAISNWPHGQINDALNKLIQDGLVRWEDPPQELSGYAVDLALRPLLEKNLKHKNREMWRKLHCRALEYYQKLAHDFPEEAPAYRKEIEYHTGQLRNEGFDPAQCSEDSEERRNA